MATYSDDFSGTLAAWTQDSGTWSISSGTLVLSASSLYRKLRYSSAMDTNDYYSQADMRSPDSATGTGVFVRGDASSTVTYYGYVFFGGDASYIVEITAGAETILATGGSTSGATTYTACRLAVTGSSLVGTRNGAADVNTTDSTLTTGRVGCMAYGSATNQTWDNWSAADTGATGQPAILRYTYQNFAQQHVGQRVSNLVR